MPVRVQQLLLEHFVAGTTARTAAMLVGVQPRTAVVFFQRLRHLIAMQQTSFVLSDETALCKNYMRMGRKVWRGPGPAQPVLVFGLFVRDGKVYTALVPDAHAEPFRPTMQERVTPDSIVYTHRIRFNNVLNVSELHHKCLKPSKTVLSSGGYHVDGIENFWNKSKHHLRRFNGIPKTTFYSFLKECEWRFNESDHRTLSRQLTYWYQARRNEP